MKFIIKNRLQEIAMFFVVFFLIITSFAQNASPPLMNPTDEESTAAVNEETVQPEPIDASEIPSQSSETIFNLDEIERDLENVDFVSTIEDEFNELKVELERMESDLNATFLSELKFIRLTYLQNNWDKVKGRLTDWQATLRAHTEELVNYNQIVNKDRRKWEITRSEALKRGDPEALLERMEEVLESINQLESILKIQLDSVLTLMDQISQQLIQINQQIIRINEAQTATRRHIFETDSRPIWSAFIWEAKKPSFLNQIKLTIDTRLLLLKDFTRQNRPRLILHFFIFGLFFVFLFTIKRHGDAWIAENALGSRFKYIYHYPFSSALLLALVFTPYLYSNLHEFIKELNRLLIIIPLIRVVPKIIYRDMVTPFFGLSALYVLQSVDVLIIDFTLQHRLTLLSISVMGALLMLWILRTRGPILKRKGGNWWWTFILFSRIALVIFIISVITNSIGNLKLAELLTNALLNIAYAGVVLLAAFLILENIIAIAFRLPFFGRLHILQRNQHMIQDRIFNLLKIGALTYWIFFALINLEIYDPLKTYIKDFLVISLEIGSIRFTLSDIFIFIITILLSILISRLIRFILEEDVLPRMKLHRGIPATISTITNYVILAIGFLIALSAAGIEWSKFALLAGAFGVGIGFGLQNVVNNFISGLILIFERPIKVEDTIEVGTLRGRVRRIGIRSSTIRTFDGAEVIVPNGTLIQSEVTNWTLSDQLRRIEVKVGVAYGTDPNRVLNLLKQVAEAHPNVLDYPAPMVLFQGFGESSLDFSLRVWTSDFDNWLALSSDMNLKVHNALDEANIEIPFPQRDLYVRSIDEKIPGVFKTDPDNPTSKGDQED